MKINIHSQHIDLNEDHKEYILSKIENLSHLGGGLDDESVIADVFVERKESHGQGVHVIMKANVAVPHGKLHAEVEDAMQVTEATDMIVAKLKNQVDKYKAKHS